MQLVEPWLNAESFKMLFVKWRIYLKNVVLQQTKYLENPCSCHFSCLNDHFLGLWSCFQHCPKGRDLHSSPFLRNDFLHCARASWTADQLDYERRQLLSARCRRRCTYIGMWLKSLKRRERKKRKRKHRSIWRKISHHYRLKRSGSKRPPHILQFAVLMVLVLVQTKVVLSLNTTPHRSHNRVRCSLPQKGSSAKVKSERKKISLSPQREPFNRLKRGQIYRYRTSKKNASRLNLKQFGTTFFLLQRETCR